MNSLDGTNRRDFLKQALSGAAVLSASGGKELLAAEPRETAAKSGVVVARDPQLRGTGSTVNSWRMMSLLDRAMQAQFDRDKPIEARRRVVRPDQTVGLKVNTLGGRGVSSNLQLVEAIFERLQEAGIKACDIVVWDRDSEELEHGGFHGSIGGNRVQCYGTDRTSYEQDLVVYSRWQPVIEDTDPALQCADQCTSAEGSRRHGHNLRFEEHVRGDS